MKRWPAAPRALALGVTLVAAGSLSACGPRTSSSPAASATSGASPSPSAVARATGACVTTSDARVVWTTVNGRLVAIGLDPHHAGVDGVAAGPAADQLRQYFQRQLTAQNLVERETDRLDDVVVLDPACSNAPLVLRVTETLVQDDYLRPDGAIDHRDARVGSQLHYVMTYERTSDGWRLWQITSLDGSSGPPPGNVV